MFSSLITLGQGQAGIWYFGKKAGLDFNVNPSVALTDGAMDTQEGCSTVGNVQGDLLFYSDGVTVYNKNHVVMANGNGLDGNSSATQSSIIVQQPGSTVLYYIFTVDAWQNNLNNGLKYSIVDLSQNGGLGAVTIKNTVLNANKVCEKITAVKHANGIDFWILMHRWKSRDFYAYLLSSSGVSAPVVSTVGVSHNTNLDAVGYMKTSTSGSKLAVAIYDQNRVELFDFNTSNGSVSNPIQLNNHSTPYGVEFSPSGNLLYISLFSTGEVLQFDLTSNVQNTINSSAQIVGNSVSWLYGALQLAPDGKIYLAKMNLTLSAGSPNLDVINSPDVTGLGCNFVPDSKSLAGRACQLGLPNFVTSLFTVKFAYQFDCEGDNTEFTITSDLTDIADVLWDFGDGTTLTSNVSPFTVNHVFASSGTYSVNLTVNLISGGTDNVIQDVIIQSLPIANDQTLSVWEDNPGSGQATGIDLSSLESAINGSSGITYTWYSDAARSTTIPTPTNVTVSNGDQFWVEIDDGNCSNVAIVTYTVNTLPMAVDQNPIVCEDNYNSGIVSNIDLTLLEPAITNNNGFLVVWYHDVNLTQPVATPNNRIVSDGEIFYAEVSTGTQTSVATITYTVESLPEGNDVVIQIWEDTFGSGFASGVNLTSYDAMVSSTAGIVWYQDAALTIAIPDPTNLTVNDKDVFYAWIDNGTCSNRGSIQFDVRSSPIANDLNIEVCEDISGSGNASNIDLTLLDGAVNGGTTASVNWFTDAAFTNPVGNPTNVTVNNNQIYYVLVQSNGESNSSTVTYSVGSLPTANSQFVVEFEDVIGSLIAQGVDLTNYNNSILGGLSNSIVWYSDVGLTTVVPDPTSQDVTDGDIFYAFISDGTCDNTATLTFTVVNTPVARDVFPDICEDATGSGSAFVDLTLLENQINEGNGDSFAWYSDWATEPNGLPNNAIVDPTNVLATNGIRFFAAVSDGSNTNVSIVTYTINPLPVAVNQIQDVWEDSFGTGIASGINLSNYNNTITQNSGAGVIWYQDITLITLVVTPNNVSVSSGIVFYALVNDSKCNNSASLTFNVRPLPEANDLQIELCEDIQGSATVSSYDLSQLETAVNNDPGTVKEWFFDAALGLPVSTPANTSISDGDSFFVRVSFGGENNVGKIDFTVNSLPIANDYQVVLCEDIYNTGKVSGESLRSHESDISNAPNSNILWYSDASYSIPVGNPQNTRVVDGDRFYARVWNGSCENFAILSYKIIGLPPTNSGTEMFCEDSFGLAQTGNVDLTQYDTQVSIDPDATIQWFEDDQHTIPVLNPANISISNQSSYYALIINSNLCENSARLNFYVNSLPEANDLSLELCENIHGSGEIENYNLGDLASQITNTSAAILSWYEDLDLLDEIFNSNSYVLTDNLTVYAKVNNGNCSNLSVINFIIHPKPIFDLGKDITIFYSESKVLDPAIDIKFLPGSYLWQDGNTSSTYTVTEEGVYKLQFTDLNSCIGRDSIMVYVDRYRIFVPNAFTPDGDGVNDTFAPVITGDLAGEDIEMYIYNRWGEMIYKFTDLGEGWNGTYKGKNANTGVYVWILLINGKARQDGTVSLIR
ncbi:PKD domain-containing protein [Ancylomarina longa]|uniref:PKD domain-containing protein n=1 Tax=Ancylomarina longa TaxID=2487017 RepID=A0A434AZI5_9BACT|nr:PKD domain-containing protein [Ancylomarina longa]